MTYPQHSPTPSTGISSQRLDIISQGMTNSTLTVKIKGNAKPASETYGYSTGDTLVERHTAHSISTATILAAATELTSNKREARRNFDLVNSYGDIY